MAKNKNNWSYFKKLNQKGMANMMSAIPHIMKEHGVDAGKATKILYEKTKEIKK